MKKILFFLLPVFLFSCENTFLEMPDTTGTVDLNAVYSSTKNAKGVLATCYRDVLVHGWPGGIGFAHGALGSISGERCQGNNWHQTFVIAQSGLNPVDGIDYGPVGAAGADSYIDNYKCIRECYLLYENIDQVPDMDDQMKGWIKGEALGLIAYRYMGMFYRYGGIPLVEHSFLATDDMAFPRATLQETYDFTLDLCNKALALLPDNWDTDNWGRLTKGAVLAMIARLQIFAARPLFNNTTPYLSNSTTDKLVCFCNYDINRWNDAIASNEAVLTWAKANGFYLINTGGAPTGQPNPYNSAVDDYGTAVSTPGNPEVILAYKYDRTDNWYGDYGSPIFYYYNMSNAWVNQRWDTDQLGLWTNFLENYYSKDGTTPDWPKIGDPEPRPASDWIDKASNLEPRFRVDYIAPGVESLSNPGDNNYSLIGWGRQTGNTSTTYNFPGIEFSGMGCAYSTRFYYKAGSRVWFEPPLFRMAEIYLNLAEAYNEVGNTAKALENLNVVHNRAGLPAITETNQDKLRGLIQREKAIEMVGENRRYYDVKHWKLSNIGNGVIGGQMRELQFYVNDFTSYGNLSGNLISYWDANTWVSYWSPKMYMEPIPQSEVNKKIVVQNPGY